MNATPPVSQIPIASDPAQQSSAASANSVKSGANGQDFAAALGNAGAKSIRKAAGHKPADGGSVGGPLPAPGNLSPPPAPPPVAGSTAAALAAATIAGALGVAATPPAPSGAAAGAAAGTPAGSAVATAAGTPAGNAIITAASTAAMGTAAISGAKPKIADPGSGSASGAPMVAPGAEGALPSGTAATPNGGGATTNATPAGIGVTASGAAATAAAGSTAQTGAAVGAAAAAGAGTAASTAMAGGAAGTAVAAATTPHPNAARPGAGASASSAGKPLTGAAATAAVNAATSGRTGTTDGSTAPSTNSGAWTSTDPTAQAVTAAAMSAAATGAVAPDAGFAGAADSPSTPTVDLATPAKGPAGPNGSPVPAALAISVARAAAAASAKAAAAAPGATTLADTSAADKRAPGGSGDALLSGMPGDGTAGAAQLSAATNGVTDATPTPTLKVSAGVDTPEFGQGLADRVSWMVDNNLNGAKLQVNPPQLGPIEVRIAVQGNHAQVWLTSHSAVTRDALESSSPKLREMLGAQGFGQVSVDISQRSYQERSAFSQPYQWTPSASPSSSAAAVQSTASSLPRLSSGAVDAYA
jgi:flagellar hook-length control protein FliK